MKIKIISAVVMTAAVLAAAAPITGVLPNPLGVMASAEEAKQYAPGDVFYYVQKYDSNNGGYYWDVADDGYLYDYYLTCTVKSDGTVKINHWSFWDSPLADDLNSSFYNETFTIPEKIGGYTVSEICCTNDIYSPLAAKKLVIPETVETIGDYTFDSWLYLEEVEFAGNSKLKTIGGWAFWNCRSLKSVTIPASVETIGQSAFANNTESSGLAENQQPLKGKWCPLGGDTVEFDFTDTYSLTEVKFAEGSKLKVLDQWAFQKQPNLKSITLPDSLEKIGYNVFVGCENLTEINVPKNVNEIGAYAFNGAVSEDHKKSSLAKITVDEDNEYYKSVDGVVFSKDGKTIVSYPPAKNGDTYEIPDGVAKIADAAFSSNLNLTSVTVPEGVEELPENAFSYATALKSVNLPSTLKTIGKWAFEATAFTSLYIPESVTAIDTHAFDSAALKTIMGKAGSYAETFAKENGYAFEEGTTPEPDDTSKPDETPNTFTDDSEDKAADVEVIAKPNVIPKEARFSVRYDDMNTTKTRIAYDCFFTYNGADYEPTETVMVKIPVPITMRDIADTLKVYHLQDGKYVNMSAKVVDGYLVFDTDHFSTYIVTAEELDKTLDPGDTNSADSSTSNPNSSPNGNPDTGIALAIAPVLLAGAAVVALKKRK